MKIGFFQHDNPNAPAAGKYYSAAPDGTLDKDTVGALTRSKYQTCNITSLAELAQWMQDNAHPIQHLTAGISEHEHAVCLPAGQTTDASGLPVIHRTNDHLNFAECTRVVCLYGFQKKSNKDYKKAIIKSEKILNDYLK